MQYRVTAVALAAFGVLTLGACSSDSASKLASDPSTALSTGSSILQVATLSDADVQALADKACQEADSKATIAGPKSKYGARLARITRGLESEDGLKLNFKAYQDKQVNAFAMANGCVRVYSGLMDMMNDGELRAVIGHEIGHVKLGHTKSAIQTAYAVTAARNAASVAGGIAASLSASQLGDLTERLINAQFSQAQESAADDYGFDFLTRRKYKTQPMVTAFQKLDKLGESGGMMSSHPGSAERAAHIRERIAKGGK